MKTFCALLLLPFMLAAQSLYDGPTTTPSIREGSTGVSVQKAINSCFSTSASSTVYTCTALGVASYITGVRYTWKPDVTSGANPTLAISGLSAITVKDANGNAPSVGAFQANSFYTLLYDGSIFRAQELQRGGSSNYLPLAISGQAYFVSKSLGNDANSGQSILLPWKTLAKVNTSTFNSGDGVFLYSQDAWQEQLTIPSSGITVGAYGPSKSCTLTASLVATCTNMPVIDGADAVSGWSVQSGAAYKASYTQTASKGFVDAVYSPTTALALQGSIASVVSTPGSIYSDGSSVYVHLLDGSNPANHTIEVSGTRKYGVFIGSKNNVTIDGIEIIRAAKSGVFAFDSSATGTGVTVSNDVFFNIGDSLADTSCSLGANSCEGSVFAWAANNQALTGWTIKGNYIGVMDFPDSTLSFTQAGIDLFGSSGLTINGNKIATQHGAAIQLSDSTFSTSTCASPAIVENEIVNSEGNIAVIGCLTALISHNRIHHGSGTGILIGGGFQTGDQSNNAPYLVANEVHDLGPAYSNAMYNGIGINHATNGIAVGNSVWRVAASSMTLEADSAPSGGWILEGNIFDASENTAYNGAAPSSGAKAMPLYVRDTTITSGLNITGNNFAFNPTTPVARYGATSSSDTTHDVTVVPQMATTTYGGVYINPAFIGTPTAPTQAQADNSTKVATTAYVDTGLGTKAASNATMTINSTSCALGGSCTVSGGGGSSVASFPGTRVDSTHFTVGPGVCNVGGVTNPITTTATITLSGGTGGFIVYCDGDNNGALTVASNLTLSGSNILTTTGTSSIQKDQTAILAGTATSGIFDPGNGASLIAAAYGTAIAQGTCASVTWSGGVYTIGVNPACLGGSSGGAPSGSAGGDLGSTYPNPTVVGLNGHTFCGGFAPSDGQVISYNNGSTCWQASTPSSGGTTFQQHYWQPFVSTSAGGTALSSGVDGDGNAITAAVGKAWQVSNTDTNHLISYFNLESGYSSTPTVVVEWSSNGAQSGGGSVQFQVKVACPGGAGYADWTSPTYGSMALSSVLTMPSNTLTLQRTTWTPTAPAGGWSACAGKKVYLYWQRNNSVGSNDTGNTYITNLGFLP